MKEKPVLSAARLRELLHYNPITGVFTRLLVFGGGRQIGDVAGFVNKCGYRVIGVEGKKYSAHHLAWLYMTGEWPTAEHMDHKNLNKSDNRWENLREATCSQNKANIRARADNTSGWKGVTAYKGKWMAQARRKGVKRGYLGLFDCPAAAHFAYAVAMAGHFGEFARAR